MTATPLLSVRNLSVSYGNIQAVRGVSFDVHEREIVTLIGGNGAGKSSTLRALSGIVRYEGGVFFDGEDLRGVSAQGIVARGIVQVPEGRGIFGNLTVMENLVLATWQRKDREEVARDFERIFSRFPRLAARRRQLGGTLSGGEQQMLAVARALMTRGRLLLLDEPSMGLSPMLVRDIFDTLVEINRGGTTILLVEQNANMALQTAARGYLLETGAVTLEGTGRELLGNPKVREAYLGGTG
ncbi:MAG: ABC transporter ATP-binding protein [Deltaproteobacteria bacterium]|nr:ABC transporter ATP-binding protein [Deltaproteobacteria bacterium]